MSAFAPLPPRLPKTVYSKMSDAAFWEATILEDITIKVPLDPRVVTWASLVDGPELKRLGFTSDTKYTLPMQRDIEEKIEEVVDDVDDEEALSGEFDPEREPDGVRELPLRLPHLNKWLGKHHGGRHSCVVKVKPHARELGVLGDLLRNILVLPCHIYIIEQPRDGHARGHGVVQHHLGRTADRESSRPHAWGDGVRQKVFYYLDGTDGKHFDMSTYPQKHFEA